MEGEIDLPHIRTDIIAPLYIDYKTHRMTLLASSQMISSDRNCFNFLLDCSASGFNDLISQEMV